MQLKTIFLPYVLLFFSSLLSYAQQPVAPVRPVVEEHCGETTVDPYRYFENTEDPEVQQWFQRQASYTRNTLDQIPGREQLEDRLLKTANRRAGQVSQVRIIKQGRYFYLKNPYGKSAACLYYRDGYEGQETLLFDPTTYNLKSGKEHVVYFHQPSPDGSKVAISVTADGAEIGTLLIMEVSTQTLYPERIEGFWFGELSWLPNSMSFFYLMPRRSNPDTTAMFNKTFLHHLRTNQSEDREILSKTNNPTLGIQDIDYPLVYVSYPDPSHLIVELGGVSANRKVFYAPISQIAKDSITWKILADIDDEVGKNAVAVRDKHAVVLTARDTERFKLVKTSLATPSLKQAEVVVPETKGVIKEFVLTSDGLFYSTVTNGVNAHLHYLANSEQEPKKINLPTQAGVIDIQSGGDQDADLWVGLGGWTLPYSRYQYRVATHTFEARPLSSESAYPEIEELVVEEVTVPSHDGTLVPLSLVYRKDIPRDGRAPTMLQGYGSYGTSIQPYFVSVFLPWIKQGGIYAVAHVRGGGELGEAWHRAGMKATKSNTWKDFIACAEYLIEEKYTLPRKLAITGGSAGGILIGRALTERPDLFAVAIPRVGLLNVTRLEEMFVGPANTKEFGSLQNHEECKALLGMDAYLHLEDSVRYPAALITAGINDSRVNPWMPAKFAARLQAATAADSPILFSVDYAAGHGLASSNERDAELWADIFSFAFWQTGHPDFQPVSPDNTHTKQ